MLWLVRNSNLRILGSVHVLRAPPRFGKATRLALDEAEVLAFEADLSIQPELKHGYWRNGATLSQSIAPKLFVDTQRVWDELDLPSDELPQCRPWLAALTIMNRVLQSRQLVRQNGVDQIVLEEAVAAGKARFFLEHVQAGLEPFARAPKSEQEFSLTSVVSGREEGLADIETMISAWESTSPHRLTPIVEKSLLRMPKTYGPALAGRNRHWIPKLLKLARGTKKVVATVGELHMVGPDCIPVLLARHGYECSLIEE